MSKKLLLETLTWLDSLHIVDKNTEFDVYSSRYRGPSNNIQGLNYPRTQDAESDEDKECVADIREYRRQSKDYSFKKWIRWIEHRRKRAKRYSKHLNNKFIATKSKLMLSSACIQVTISTWQTFCCIAKGIQQWKNFVQRKKKYRLQYSLYRALRNSILHIGPKITQRNSYQFKSSSVEWLTKNYQLRMMLKYWKISTTFHKNKKTNIFHIWHKKYLACMKLHHVSQDFDISTAFTSVIDNVHILHRCRKSLRRCLSLCAFFGGKKLPCGGQVRQHISLILSIFICSNILTCLV